MHEKSGVYMNKPASHKESRDEILKGSELSFKNGLYLHQGIQHKKPAFQALQFSLQQLL